VLGEATRALIWWPLGALQLWGATGFFFKFHLKVGVEESIIINPSLVSLHTKNTNNAK
jgi:hypothetical protein